MNPFPRLATVEVDFPRPRVDDIEGRIRELFEAGPLPDLRGQRIAVAAGSRGISNLAQIVGQVITGLKERGAHPFIVPSMGSHAGATPEGQAGILAHYGVTESAVGAPVCASLETVQLGKTPDGIAVYMGRPAYESDGIVLINRIKPHTDFKGTVESGLMKMMVIGVGKIDGADSFHAATLKLPHDYLLKTMSAVSLNSGKIRFGIAVLENAFHETAQLELVPAAGIASREPRLLERAKELMPSLPADPIDMLIVNRIGKDISGSGMDPNVTGRWFRINSKWQEKPNVTRIVALDLTENSGGNAVGIGLADFCSRRLVTKMNPAFTYLNAITSRSTVPAEIPIHFDTDRETLRQAMHSLGVEGTAGQVRLIRIEDTLSLTRLQVSESLLAELDGTARIRRCSEPREMEFDAAGNLLPMN